MEAQRMFVRFIQPMLLGGFVICCLKIKKVLGLMILLVVGFSTMLTIASVIWILTVYREKRRNLWSGTMEDNESEICQDLAFTKEILQNAFHRDEIDSDDWNQLVYLHSSAESSTSDSYVFSESSDDFILSDDVVLTISAGTEENDYDDESASSLILSQNSSRSASYNSYLSPSLSEEEDL